MLVSVIDKAKLENEMWAEKVLVHVLLLVVYSFMYLFMRYSIGASRGRQLSSCSIAYDGNFDSISNTGEHMII